MKSAANYPRDIHCFYRLAPKPVADLKPKLHQATKRICFENFRRNFSHRSLTVIGDCLDEELKEMVSETGTRLVEVQHGSGGGSFREAAGMAMQLPDETFVYLVEDDFLHRPESLEAMNDGLLMGAEYVTLYDHPDKYLSPKLGGNPHVHDGGEDTLLLCGKVCHWKITNSTVMTFATTAGQLRRDWAIFLSYCGGRYTDDYRLFRTLSRKGRKLISAIPGFATHCEERWLSPFTEWAAIANETTRAGQISGNQASAIASSSEAVA